jgi:SLOG in TRPM, prokaryote
LRKQKIIFSNGKRADLVAPPLGTPAADILKALDLGAPKALILVVGGASNLDKTLVPRLLKVCSRTIAGVAADTGAIIIDGGTQAGVMAIMGQAVADRGGKPPLLGVAPKGKVTYPGGPGHDPGENRAALDPNHSHFVLVESREWGGETETFYELAESLAKKIKVITILINGGTVARKEILASVRHGWPIVVLAGTGRLADEIARLMTSKPDLINDPDIAEIISDGDIYPVSLQDPDEDLEKLFFNKLSPDPAPDR